MIWHSDGGGPWGTGPRGGGGGGGPGGGGGGGPWGSGRGGGGGPRGPVPPNFEEMLRRSQDRFRRILPGGFSTGTGVAVVLIAIVVLWMASGFYRVQPDEVGVEYHLPHSRWIDLLHANGFEVERLIDVYAAADSVRHDYYGYVSVEWARKWPVEEIWQARRV